MAVRFACGQKGLQVPGYCLVQGSLLRFAVAVGRIELVCRTAHASSARQGVSQIGECMLTACSR